MSLRLSWSLGSLGRTACRKCSFCATWQTLNLRIWRCAAAQRFCSVYAHEETVRRRPTAALRWTPVLPSLHAVLIGETGVKQAAALTWWSENVRRLRVTDWRIHRSAFTSGPPHLTPAHAVVEPEHFHRGGQSETIAHTGVARKPIFVRVAHGCGSGCCPWLLTRLFIQSVTVYSTVLFGFLCMKSTSFWLVNSQADKYFKHIKYYRMQCTQITDSFSSWSRITFNFHRKKFISCAVKNQNISKLRERPFHSNTFSFACQILNMWLMQLNPITCYCECMGTNI